MWKVLYKNKIYLVSNWETLHSYTGLVLGISEFEELTLRAYSTKHEIDLCEPVTEFEINDIVKYLENNSYRLESDIEEFEFNSKL